ncbi:MAG: 3'-5' exonuclease [Chlamydiales bacterium]|nr:3'-5' exonuclease [Chlamydiales bacterium]
MLLIFLDTETTGLDPDKHRTLEIAYRVIDSLTDRSIVSYETLVSQPLEVWAEADPESLEINGFTWEETLSGKPEKVVASEILNDLNHLDLGKKEGVFICQNPSFDRSFFTQLINVELQRHNGWPYHWLDLASMYWGVRLSRDPEFSKGVKESDLSKNKIAGFYGIGEEGMPHRAMNGVDHLITCYKSLFS